jgi:hypothetical protein
MKGKRTGIDFSKHVLTEKHYGDGDVSIYTFKIPGTVCHSVNFINACGVLTVNGDFGNWVFCREFHPSADGYVSDNYWVGKLKNSSSQKPGHYDSETTEKELREEIKRLEEEKEDYSKENYEEYKDYLETCLRDVDDELEYTYQAYRNQPGFMDYESVIFCKSLDEWLLIIFDAFDAICSLKKEAENINPAVENAQNT